MDGWMGGSPNLSLSLSLSRKRATVTYIYLFIYLFYFFSVEYSFFQNNPPKIEKNKGVSHCGLAIKKYLKAKRRTMETQIFYYTTI